jgi:hypothetical protein
MQQVNSAKVAIMQNKQTPDALRGGEQLPFEEQNDPDPRYTHSNSLLYRKYFNIYRQTLIQNISVEMFVF